MTNVRFSHDMMRVISVGGGDHAIFQWRYLPEGSHGDDSDEADGGAYLESNSDESDSEASDVDELDSDIENVSTLRIFLCVIVFYTSLSLEGILHGSNSCIDSLPQFALVENLTINKCMHGAIKSYSCSRRFFALGVRTEMGSVKQLNFISP